MKLTHIFIMLAMVALFAAAMSWHAVDPAFAESNQEKEDPIITYDVPKDLNLLDESFCLNAKTVNCDAELSYRATYPDYLQVDQDGNGTILNHENAFSTQIIIFVPETEITNAKEFVIQIDVDWVPQTITCKSKLSTTLGKSVTIKATALGALSYQSSNTSTAKVTSSGKVTFLHPGIATITVTAASTGVYWIAKKKVSVSCKMTAPKLTVTRPHKKCAKLTWTKVGGAKHYMIYVKYPGKKKYKPVLSKSYKVKSVTHKGLKSGKKYSYKVRGYLISGGDVYYGPYSKAVTVKIK